ncbi:MAG: hypothetical protein JSV20_02250 [Candidatus Bathyarchaeota archaeon]|nr:MAG: hypothetical protein JSV20_02250 [Candidatus Bathyarchaeota archaeon]
MPTSTLLSILFWLLGTFTSSLFCLLIGLISIKALSYITSEIKEFEVIKGDAVAISLFVGGFIVFTSLIIHGSSLNPIFQGNVIDPASFINIHRVILILLAYGIGLTIGWLFYKLFAKVELFGIDLDDINKSPQAIGLFLFCYEVFIGLIVHASLSLPL